MSDEKQVRALFEEMRASLPPLRGVIHSAMVLDDGVILQQTLERLHRVMAPKAQGAWNLHRCSEGRELDFFVLFSSAATLVGAPGQSNYTAANAFTDELVRYRRQRGLPASSIAWGAWANVGQAVAQENRAIRRFGYRFHA